MNRPLSGWPQGLIRRTNSLYSYFRFLPARAGGYLGRP